MKKKSNIVWLVAICIFIVGAITGGLKIKKRIDDRTVNIAFYGVSEELSSLIKSYIPEIDKVQINIDNLASGNIDLGNITKKYDLLICWKGDVSESFSGGVEHIPGKILDSIPSSLRNKYFLPLLLDHYEIDLYSPVVNKTQLQPPASFSDFTSYLENARNSVFSPFFAAGGDDRTLLALTGTLVEAQAGLEAYNKLISVMKKSTSLSDFIDEELAPDYSFRTALDLLKTWPKMELAHPQWFMGSKNDLIMFTQENQIGAFFAPLSYHRTMNFRVINDFESIRFPVASYSVNHGVVAPALGTVMISDNSYCEEILRHLVSVDVQNDLSLFSMLAPVNSRAEAYDVQADDVRFWAASCAGGALPDLALAVYQRKPDSLKSVASEIRSYLK